MGIYIYFFISLATDENPLGAQYDLVVECIDSDI